MIFDLPHWEVEGSCGYTASWPMSCTTAAIAVSDSGFMLALSSPSASPQTQVIQADPGSPQWQRMRVNCAQQDLVQQLTAFKQTFLLVYRDLMIHPHKVADWSA